MIPKDPVMLLSYVNTQLRDFYSSQTRKRRNRLGVCFSDYTRLCLHNKAFELRTRLICESSDLRSKSANCEY